MMIRRLLLVFVVTLVCARAHAEMNYAVERVIPGYSVRQIEAGLPIGGFREAVQLKLIDGKSPKTVLSEERARRIQEVEQSKGDRDVFLQQFAAKSATADVPSTSAPASAPAPSGAARIFRSVQYPEFKECALKALPILKAAYLASLKKSDSDSKKILLALDDERGESKGESAAGLACGKYLGSIAIVKPALLDEIKILSALTTREKAETQTLAMAYVVRFLPDAPPEARALWSSYWDRLSAKAVLTNANLESLDDLKKTYSTARVDTGVTVVAADSSKFEKLHDLGLRFARETVKGVGL